MISDRQVLAIGVGGLATLGLGYAAWRYGNGLWIEALERGDFEEANRLAGGQLEAGRLVRSLAVPTALLGCCVVGLAATLIREAGVAPVVPKAIPGFGYSSYL